MAELLALFDHQTAATNRIVVQCPQQAITAAGLLAAAGAVSQLFADLGTDLTKQVNAASPAPSNKPYVINLCKNRYQFMVGFCAALLNGCTSLLPANRQLQTITELSDRYPGSVIVLDDDGDEFAGFNCLDIRACTQTAVADSDGPVTAVPMIAADHIAAIVFTSGSSGQPSAIRKPWRTFVGTASLLAQRFIARYPGAALVATVPPQHMYGLETTVMMALHGGVTVHSGQPFFADDIRAALEQIPSPRILVTTPVHLRALLASTIALPSLAGLISATAPLDPALARLAEVQLGCPVSEIFGCSEAGSFASRLTSLQVTWTMLDGMVIVPHAAGHSQRERQEYQPAAVRGSHLLAEVPLEDQLELLSDRQFNYLGRSSDMLNVAGKRASLADLSRLLLQIEGVEDAVFFIPDHQEVATQRPAALAVSRLSPRAILAALATTIDPVFLPRPLKIVAQIPRNEVGKIPRKFLQQLLQKQ